MTRAAPDLERLTSSGMDVDQSAPSTSYGKDIVVDSSQSLTHDGLSFFQHMLAGSLAGMVEHMAMFPVDTIKTRMQMLIPASAPTPYSSTPRLPSPMSVTTARAAVQASFTPSVGAAVANILRREGPGGLYRGIAAMGLGAGPAHAVYFAVYELAKVNLGGGDADTAGSGQAVAAHAAAGAMATVASDAVLTPMDVVKQRLQLARSPYRGVWDCCARMAREEGPRSFFASYRTTLAMNVPFTAIHFATYEAAKRALHGTQLPQEGGGEAAGRGEEEETLMTHLVAGGAAGALASAVTNPLDVVKTRLQCQGVCGARRFLSSSVLAAMRAIWHEEGPRAFSRGIRARVLFHTPAAAICWSTYEAAKSFLHKWNASKQL